MGRSYRDPDENEMKEENRQQATGNGEVRSSNFPVACCLLPVACFLPSSFFPSYPFALRIASCSPA